MQIPESKSQLLPCFGVFIQKMCPNNEACSLKSTRVETSSSYIPTPILEMTYQGLVLFLCLLGCSSPVFTSQITMGSTTVYGRQNSLVNTKVPVPFTVKRWAPVLPCNKETRVCIAEFGDYVVLQGTLTKNESYMLYNGTGTVDTRQYYNILIEITTDQRLLPNGGHKSVCTMGEILFIVVFFSIRP
ncbi:hypothetical protein SprV_0100372000 [Sparganum proliferum]